LLASLLLLMPTAAQAANYLTVETTTYEWVEEEATGGEYTSETAEPSTSRYATSSTAAEFAKPSSALAAYGPFRVVSAQRAEIVGDIETSAPQLFAKMLKAYPAINRIDFIDCPGTTDDSAIFAVARMIRKSGITTHVPAGGFVGSGGVELFLSGTQRSASPSAEFAVHSWMDEDGRQASDFSKDDPVHQDYLKYYREIGMSSDKAQAFYQLTNSAPFEEALYLKPRDIAQYILLN